MLKIVIADDHPIYRSGIKSVIEAMPFTEVVGEASDGMEAYQLIISKFPDIAIMDIEMPLLSGLDVSRKSKKEKCQTKIILLTMHKEKEYFVDAMECGVDGYLLKDSAGQELAHCIKTVGNGKKYVSENIESFLTELMAHVSSEELKLMKEVLTPTEKVVLKLISEGKATAEIAAMLFISTNTVENHRANMKKKLKLDGGRNSLLKFAYDFKDFL